MEHIIKQCIVCDTILTEEKQYITNHYLCSVKCSKFYSEISVWNPDKNCFNPDIKRLNFYRLKVKNIKELSIDGLNYRRDYENENEKDSHNNSNS